MKILENKKYWMFALIGAVLVVAALSSSDDSGDFGVGTTAGEGKTLRINGVEYAFRWRPPGSFEMGAPEWEDGFSADEGPRHQVTLTQGFWLLETEVTQ